MRNYAALSSTEYEKLIGDLFGAKFGVQFERFGSGADQGIDLRHLVDGNGPLVIQVKHYLGSSWSDLKKAAKKEKTRLEKLTPTPSRYLFVTSQSLTPTRKATLADALTPFITTANEVFGREDVDDLLDQHEQVERRHPKLWLASAAALAATVHSGVHARSHQLTAEIAQKLPLWVQSNAYFQASSRLDKERVLVISGQSGIGKTTLAQILVARAMRLGYEGVVIGSDVEEAWAALDTSERQIFLYDDFLGQTSQVELSKNEDSRLVSFMKEVASSETKLFVLTTREYILQRALQISESLRRHGLNAERVLLDLSSYSELDRARILANHVWHSQVLPIEARTQLAESRGYRRIVRHPNFNPRLIEFVTGHHRGHPLDVRQHGGTWLEAAIDALNHPHEIWRSAYEHQLNKVERGVVLVLATLTRRAQVDDLRAAHDSWCNTAGVESSPRRFERALKVVDDSFVSIARDGGEQVVAFANPGVRDYVERQLREDHDAFADVLDSTIFFEQIERMWNLVCDAPSVLLGNAFMASCVAAIDRAYAAPSSAWSTCIFRSGARQLKRREPRLDARLSIALNIAGAPGAPPQLADWISEQLGHRATAWMTAAGRPGDALELVGQLADQSAIKMPLDWEEALKTTITSDPWGPDEWQYVIDLREMIPTLFPADDWDAIRSDFLLSAESFLVDNSDNLDAHDEIEAMSVIAESMGVELDAGWIKNAEDVIDERLAREDREESMEIEPRQEARAVCTQNPTSEMDAIFRHLASD